MLNEGCLLPLFFLGVFKFALRPNGGWRREFEGLPEIEGLIEGPLSVFV